LKILISDYIKSLNKFSLINAFKAVIASLVGYIIGHLLGLWLEVSQMYTWIVVTVLVVMSSQPNLGGALGKAKMRLLGTVIGSSAAIIILLVSPNHQWIQIILSLILIFVGVYVATASNKYMYAGVLACVTITIILFSKEVTLITAFYRTLEVVLGIFIAIITNRFILPIRASDRLYYSFSETLLLIKQLHGRMFNDIDYDYVLVNIFLQFTKQLSLQNEIINEKEKVNLNSYKVINSQLRQLYRYSSVINDYMTSYPDKKIRFSNSIEFHKLNITISGLIDQMSLSFKYKRPIFHDSPLQKITKQLNSLKDTMKVEPKYIHTNTLIFSLEKNIEILKTISITSTPLI